MKYDIKLIFERVKILAGVKNQKEMAEILGTSESNLSKLLKRGGALKHIVQWAFQNNVDMNYLFYGMESKEIQHKFEILKKIQSWMEHEDEKDKDFPIWFKVEFEKKYPEYTKWKKEKEEANKK